MGKIKGQSEFLKFKQGISLTRKQTMLAKCYECNGEEESQENCLVDTCPLYLYHPHKNKAKKGLVMV